MSFWGPAYFLFSGSNLLLVWGDQQQDVGAEGAFVACDGTLARQLSWLVVFFLGFPYKKNLGN